MRSKLQTWSPAAVALIGGAAFVAMIGPPTLPYARTHDFLGLYSGGLLARTNPAHLYDPELQSKVQHELAPQIPVFTPFPRPAFSSLVYIPLTWMPLETAFAVWIALGSAVALAIMVWIARRFGPDALVFCAFFVPLLYGILHGQDAVFVTAIAILAFLAAERGRNALCGALLALLLAKFNLFMLIPVVLLVRREWRILAGYAPVALSALAVSVAMASPRSYIDFLRNPNLEALHTSPEMMINLNAIAINLGLDHAIVRILLTLGVLATVLLIPRSAPVERWFWATVCAGLLISPHTFEYDATLLLVPILKIVSDSRAARPLRWIAATAAIPLPYFMTLLPKPFSAGPALVIALLCVSLAWPEWFDRRLATTADPSPTAA